MSSKHLSTDSECPEVQKGLIRCYSMKYCPYAERTLIVLEKKKLNYEIVNVDLHKKPLWLVDKNPLKKVPILEMDGQLIIESVHTCNYLDELYPDPPLYPKDIHQKYRQKALVDIFQTKIVTPLVPLYYTKLESQELQEKLKPLKEGLEYFEAYLREKGTPFFSGETPGMADYMIWPFFERFPAFQQLVGVNFFTGEGYCHLDKFVQEMKNDETLQKILITDDKHRTYIENLQRGIHSYDF